MVAQGGQQAAEAVGVANAEVMAAQQAANERRALWMKYLRSRGIVPASQQQRNAGKESSRSSRQNKCPEHMKEAVNKNPQHYFEQWLTHGGEWGKIEIEETKTTTQTAEEDGEDEWLMPHDVVAKLPAEIAQKLMDAQRGQAGYHRSHPLSTDDALSFYKVPNFLLQRHKSRNQSEQHRKMTAKFDNQSSEQAMAVLADGEAASRSGHVGQLALTDEAAAKAAPPKSVAEIAEENRIKAEEAEAKKKAQAEKIQQPAYRANKWKVRVAHSLTDLHESLMAIDAFSGWGPKSLADEYKKIFEESKATLLSHREQLEKHKVPSEDLIAQAEQSLQSFILHLDGWNTLNDKYKSLQQAK